MDFLKVPKGGPFGLAGGRIPEGRGRPAQSPPPKSAPVCGLSEVWIELFINENCMAKIVGHIGYFKLL